MLWGRGTNDLKYLSLISLTLVFSLSCTTTAKKNNDDSELNDEDLGEGSDVMDPEYPHPTQVSASSTKQLLITHDQPSAQDLDACRANLLSSANATTSVPALAAATENFDMLISESPSKYHWCFYQILSQLDDSLASTTLELTQKYQTFVNEVKILFILAQALDAKISPPVYCQYLKLRYVDISRNYFGRRLSVIQNTGCGVYSDNHLSSNNK